LASWRHIFVLLTLMAGPIALQAQEKSPTTQTPIVLFDGKSLNGWHQAGPAGFDLKDGILTAHGGMGLLWNDREFGDFVLRLEFQVTKKEDNSGVFVRFPDPGNDPLVAVNQGHEIQICDTEPNNRTGAIYNFKDATELATKSAGAWNQMEIKAVSRTYSVTINGKLVNEFTSDRGVRGHIGLQNHWSTVSFRNITAEELPGGAEAVAAGKPVSIKEPAPGLVGEYFNQITGFKSLTKLKDVEPFFVRVDPQIEFAEVTGEFYGTHLSEDFGIRWTGAIHIDKPGTYVFTLRSDDGSKLAIGGKTVIDHSRPHKMEDKSGQIRFTATGNYALRLEYNQAGNGAGCILSWQVPGDSKPSVVPSSSLLHERASENIAWNKEDWQLFTADHRAWIKKHGRKFEKMDYGPFLAGTFVAPQPKDNITLKGTIVKLNAEGTANILFDTELLRYSAGWIGDFIDFHGVTYDGAHGVDPSIKGQQLFGTLATPAWEHDAGFNDPRPKPYGPLPEQFCHYRGLYRHGDQVVFSYTVNGVGVLDLPGLEKSQGNCFTRTLRIDATKQPLTLCVAQRDTSNGWTFALPEVIASPGVVISRDEGRVLATFSPHEQPEQYAIWMRQVIAGSDLFPSLVVAKPAVDFDLLCSGGQRRWGEPIVTQGVLGEGDRAYVVDTLTAPENNPFDSWLRFGGFDFFKNGTRAAICTWNGDVWIVSGIDSSLKHLTWQRYATGLFQSLGLKIVNDEVYVLGRDQITRLHDLNGDGEADFYENFNNDCQVSAGFHEFAHDLQVDSHGNFYYAKGGPVNPGGRGFEKLTDHAGTIIKVSPDGKKSEVFATGLRAPNGMSVGPHDEITVSDNQGTWTPACRISFVTQGSFLGVPDTAHVDPKPTNYGNPICWFPYVEGDYTTGDNSSGGGAWVIGERWGPFKDQLIHLSYGTCSIFKTMYENVDGIWQGGVVRFPLDFDSGIMRARFNPVDGQLYVCGLKGWQTRAQKDGVLQRVRYTGKPVQMPTEMHVQKDGIAITFTTPLDPSNAIDTGNYDVQQWNYIWSSDYGSPEVSRDDPKKKGRESVEIESIMLAPDAKTITLKIPDLKPVMQVKIQMKIKAANGSPMDFEIDGTINKVPGQPAIATPQPPANTQAKADP
jgi:hypothetical protein